MCELDTFVTGILLCYYFLTGNELSVAEFWERNEESMPKVQGALEEMTKNLFQYQEKKGLDYTILMNRNRGTGSNPAWRHRGVESKHL